MFLALLILMATVVLLIFTESSSHSHIEINGLRFVNMYFSKGDLEVINETATKGQRQIKISKCTCENRTNIDQRMDNTTQLEKELTSSIHKTPHEATKKNSINNGLENTNQNLDYGVKNDTGGLKKNWARWRGYIHELEKRKSRETLPRKGDEIQTNPNNNVPVDKGICTRRFPDCIIIGVQKCGTKALAEFLKIHPNISLDSRQTYFFSQNYWKGLDWYRDQMACSDAYQFTLERTPQYFYFKEVPRRIYDMNKLVKIVLITCDPVTRAISNFAMAKDRNRAELHDEFEQCVLGEDNRINASCKYVRKSNYQKFMKYWLEIFPLKQIHIANGKRLIEEPVTELRKVEQFLGVPSFIREENFIVSEETGFKCLRNRSDSRIKCLSRRKGRAHPEVKENVLTLLREFFKPRNLKFFSLVKQTFDW